jgi:hypothetical protein
MTKHESVARGATRMAVRKVTAFHDADVEVFERQMKSGKYHVRSRTGRERLIRELGAHAVGGRVATTKNRHRTAWMDLTYFSYLNRETRGFLILHHRIELREGDANDHYDRIYVDPHLGVRIAQRADRLDVQDVVRELALETAGWLFAAEWIGARKVAVPFLDGVVFGRREHGQLILKTYLPRRTKGKEFKDRLDRLIETLPPLPKIPRIDLVDPDTCVKVAQAMAGWERDT